MESWEKEFLDYVLFGDNVKFNGKCTICSTCKHYNGKSCSKGKAHGGFATKLSDCNEWEVCNG
jgi:hypothetical protein